MSVGDLVWAYGSRGLILEVSHGMYSTEYLIFWIPQPHQYGSSWIAKKHLIKVC